MAIAGIDPKCYILALFVRDDGVRFLLGDDPYEFKDKQLHFQPNTVANDVVEVQGNDGYLLAGQVRRPGTQSFDGYVCNGTNSKAEVEVKRREFLQFFRRSHFYKVIYVFPNGTAIQRKQGFLVDDPTVQELYQQYPEYHVALNFEDVNYYTYEEDDQGQEIYAKEAIVPLAGGGATGGLIWDEYGVVWEDPWSDLVSVSGSEIQIDNEAGARAPIQDLELQGDTYQQTYSGKNLFNVNGNWVTNQASYVVDSVSQSITVTSSSGSGNKYIRLSVQSSGGVTYAASAEDIQFSNSNQTSFFRFNEYANGSSIPNASHQVTPTQKSITFTTQPQCDELRIYIYVGVQGGGAGDTATYVKLQLESGSTATSFEPYVGGIPSPNPDYPQEVQTVTGEQTVDVHGKNLCNINVPFPFTTSNGLTVDLDNDGFIVINGTASSKMNIMVSTDQLSFLQKYNGRQCTLSFESSGTGSIRNIGLKQDSGANIISIDPNSNPKTGTLNLASISTAKWQMWTVSGDSFTNYRIRPQFELGSTVTAYEPYQGQTYIIDLRGKNLLNIADFAMGGLSNGNPTTSSYRIQNASHPIAVQPNTTYTLSAQLVSPVQGFRVGVHECRADGSFIGDSGWKQLYVPNTFTTGPNTYCLKIVGSLSTTSTNVSTGGTENTTACTTVTEFMRGCTLQLEKGTTATAYTPFTQTELCKIGDYQDYIYKSGDGWYVHKETGKAVFDGDQTETWKQSGAYNAVHNIQLADILPADNNNRPYQSKIYCDHFTLCDSGYNGGYLYPSQNGTMAITSDKYLSFNYSQTTSIAMWTTWLSSNNVSAYYPIATPTDTKITDATLVGQLEALGAMKLFIGENNLQVSATGTNLPATLEFSYPTKFAKIGAEWEEGGTKGATIVNVNAIDNTYPVWELRGPAVNPTLSVLTTNTTLTYNGTITASQKLVIDMFNKTATLNGTSVIGNVSGDFVYMAPGTNRIAYTAGNTDAPDSTIYWQEVVG